MESEKAAVILGFVKKENEQLIINCIEGLKAQTFKNFEIYIYDNSRLVDGLSEVRKKFPEVQIQKNEKNLGFAGGNNSVMRKLLKLSEYKYIALLNDDTKAAPTWLEALVQRAESDNKIGAVTSKLIYYEDFVRVEGNFNGEKLKWFEESGFSNSKYNRKFPRSGFVGFEIENGMKYSFLNSEFSIDLPIGTDTTEDYVLKLKIEKSVDSNNNLEIKIGDFTNIIQLLDGYNTYEIKVPKEVVLKNKFSIIQNASSSLTAQFTGYDIGNLNNQAEVDHGQYDESKEAMMICGGAVLFRAEALKDVGIFDEYFFVYYEDADLSFRLKRRNWKLIYEPKALVRHIHNASSTEYSPLFVYHVNKNKPAFVLKNLNIRPNIYTISEIFRETFKYSFLALKYGFKNSYRNSRARVQVKSLFKFLINVPLILLKRFYIVKSN